MLRAQIEKSGFESAVGRRVVLTGGTSQLHGFRNLAEVVLDKSVRVAKPHGLEGLTGLTAVPQFATAAGLVMYGAQRASQRVRSRQRSAAGAGVLGQMGRWLKESFQAG